MPITETHELHTRRRGRNIGVGLTLMAFAAIVFLLTLSKIRNGGAIEGFDHSVRPSLTVEAEE